MMVPSFRYPVSGTHLGIEAVAFLILEYLIALFAFGYAGALWLGANPAGWDADVDGMALRAYLFGCAALLVLTVGAYKLPRPRLLLAPFVLALPLAAAWLLQGQQAGPAKVISLSLVFVYFYVGLLMGRRRWLCALMTYALLLPLSFGFHFD